HRGQVVRFRGIGVARRAHGAIRFRAVPGGAAVIADVAQDGYPRTSLTVARYAAPKLKTLQAPKHVVARRPRDQPLLRLRPRRGAQLVVGWRRVAGATGYAVGVWTPDGREVGFSTRARTVTVHRLFGSGRSRVMVRAVRLDGRMGHPTTIKEKR